MPEERRSLETLDLIGGSPALDFANTINSRRAPAHDYLGSFLDLLEWEQKAGLIDDGKRIALAARSTADPTGSARALGAARELREAIYRTFSARASGALPSESDLRVVLRAHAAAIAAGSASLGTSGSIVLSWGSPTTLRNVVHPIAHAAGVLLLGPPTGKVGECPSCAWLFLDRTRNGSRRWCDMRTCGSRDKMRRYYRTHAGGIDLVRPARSRAIRAKLAP